MSTEQTDHYHTWCPMAGRVSPSGKIHVYDYSDIRPFAQISEGDNEQWPLKADGSYREGYWLEHSKQHRFRRNHWYRP